jgi:hypothetical protein
MGPKSWVLLFLRRLVRAPQLIHWGHFNICWKAASEH